MLPQGGCGHSSVVRRAMCREYSRACPSRIVCYGRLLVSALETDATARVRGHSSKFCGQSLVDVCDDGEACMPIKVRRNRWSGTRRKPVHFKPLAQTAVTILTGQPSSTTYAVHSPLFLKSTWCTSTPYGVHPAFSFCEYFTPRRAMTSVGSCDTGLSCTTQASGGVLTGGCSPHLHASWYVVHFLPSVIRYSPPDTLHSRKASVQKRIHLETCKCLPIAIGERKPNGKRTIVMGLSRC